MKTLAALILLTATVFLAGCSTDPDDQAFFEKGWRHPGARDAQ